MNIEYDDVEMQFNVSVSFAVKVKETVHVHADLEKVEERIINDIYKNIDDYVDDDLEVEDVERII